MAVVYLAEVGVSSQQYAVDSMCMVYSSCPVYHYSCKALCGQICTHETVEWHSVEEQQP